MEKFNEIALTVDRREMRTRRAVFLMIATLLLWCGSMLLVLDLAANASGTHGQVALIGLVLVAIGGSCLWADFFEVTSWFARERWVTGHVPPRIHAAFYPRSFTREAHLRRRTAKPGMQKTKSKRLVPSQARDADEGHVQVLVLHQSEVAVDHPLPFVMRHRLAIEQPPGD